MQPNQADDAADPKTLGGTDQARPRRQLREAFWIGAKAGARRASSVAWPIVGLMTTLNIALTVFAAGAGRGWGISPFFPAIAGVFLVIEIIGVLGGGVIGLFRRSPAEFREPRETSERPDLTEGHPQGLRWPWLLGILVVLAEVIAFGAGTITGRAVDRRLADAIALADLDDPTWRIKDLIATRAAIPDAENSALVVTKALTLLPQFWPEQLGLTFNDPDLLNEALQRLEATPDNVRLDDPTASVLRLELNKQAEAVRVARTVADFPRGRFEVVLGSTLMDTRLPHGNTNRDVAKLLAADAAIRAHDGDLDGALDSCRAILGVAWSFGDEPMLVSQLIRMKIVVNAVTFARRVLGQGEPSDAALARFQAQLLGELDQPSLLIGLRSDRGMVVEIIRRIANGEIAVSSLSGDSSARNPKAVREPMSPWGRLALENQQAMELEWMNRLIVIARRPILERPPLIKVWQAEVDRVKQGWFAGQIATLPLLFIPVDSMFADADPRYRAEVASMVVLLAAERHRLKAGEWPSSIGAIDPSLLPESPFDPFSGQSFPIERIKGEFLVHSIGPNLEDEHGACYPHRTFETRPAKDRGPDDLGSVAWDVSRRRSEPEVLPK